MSLSRRSGFPRLPNALARLVAEAGPLLDLTSSNPTTWGFSQPDAVAALAHPKGSRYAPDPQGSLETREAICRYYGRRDVALAPERLVLSASSSEAYGWLFKLLCDPGDVVLAPEPSYPLFPFLAALEGVTLTPYPLVRADGFRIDLPALRDRIEAQPRARAILVVHPANPTGTLVADDERQALLELCRAHDLALIADEVFYDYRTCDADSFAGVDTDVLTFVLSGLSKVALLPQLKLGWTAVRGPDASCREALDRLELIADCYLSVTTAVQLAAPAILDGVDPWQDALRARLRHNRARLEAHCADTALSVVPSEGGWYALVELPRTRSDDGWIELFVREESIAVQPGYFYDIAEPGTVVLSLLLSPDVFEDAVGRLVACVTAHA